MLSWLEKVEVQQSMMGQFFEELKRNYAPSINQRGRSISLIAWLLKLQDKAIRLANRSVFIAVLVA